MFDFFGNHLSEILKFRDVIKSHIYNIIGSLDIEAYWSREPLIFADRTRGEKKTLKPGDKWGDVFDCAWFHFTGSVPVAGEGGHVVLLIDINGEACVFNEKGEPVRGLTNGSSTFETVHGMPGKRVLQYSACAKTDDAIDIWADAGCNDLFGVLSNDGRVDRADIAVCRADIRSLYYDYWTLCDLLEVLDRESARYAKVVEALGRAHQLLQTFDEDNVARARDILAVELGRKNADPALTVSAIGHAHIDLAWLWPIRETIRKGARTFSTVLELMDRYPDYKFGCSQPQLYDWIKEYYPALYERIKEKVKEGRWELQGGMWVEADTNVTSGESLIRQFLYGKEYYLEEFGIDVKSLWLPDVFGYSAALPQIIKMCGMDYFMTQKLSWNDTNRFPHHTFYWNGLDGSGILTHMLPEETYNSHAGPRAISKAEKNYSQKNISDRCLLLFGIGDGGGGPGAEHLEQLERLKNLQGLAPVEQEFSCDFFKRIDKDIDYPKWHGELYLEKHRGTYTTQARTKKYNRLLEFKLRDLELLSCIASLKGLEYPQQHIDKIWKEVLLYQFHDILPGSSIKRVYDEAEQRYEQLLGEVETLTASAIDVIVKDIVAPGKAKPMAVFNTLSWKRNEWIRTYAGWLKAEVGPMGLAVIDAAPMGLAVIDAAQDQIDGSSIKADERLLENELLRLEFAPDGSLVSVYDKENNFEGIKPGCRGNLLKVYIDKGDAWDFPNNYRKIPCEYFKLKSSRAYIDGPCAVIEQKYTYNNSALTQRIVLTAGSRRADFITEVDWNESFRMLRCEFPVNVFAEYAACDIQMGSVKRPTFANTSWDEAKLEVCAHKYVDISQSDRGIALLNDCKYGYRVFDNIIDLNLLRSPSYPGIDADKGKHIREIISAAR
jgi:alpha-mannosidase